MKEALEFCRDQTLNDKRSDLVLLYDKNLPEQLVGELDQLKKPRKEGGFGWKKVVPWESFVGGECDTVVYVGSGSLEAFSRARLKLMIITVSPREQRGDTVNNFYGYNAGLKNSVEKNLIKRKEIRQCEENKTFIEQTLDAVPLAERVQYQKDLQTVEIMAADPPINQRR